MNVFLTWISVTVGAYTDAAAQKINLADALKARITWLVELERQVKEKEMAELRDLNPNKVPRDGYVVTL